MQWDIVGYLPFSLTGMDVQPERNILIEALENWIEHLSMKVQYTPWIGSPYIKRTPPLWCRYGFM